MACERDLKRKSCRVSEDIDAELAYAMTRVAFKHGLSVSDVIECALTYYISLGLDPVEPRWCKAHRCAMIYSSHGVWACPVEEHEPNMVFIPENIK